MEPEEIAIFKEELRKRGLDPEQWHRYIEEAWPVCLAYAETLRLTEDYATNSIEALEDSAELFEAALYIENVFDEIAKATKTVMVSF